jgi:hypothetical protein
MKTTPFVVSQSCHGMPCIQADNLNAEQCQRIREIIVCQWMQAEEYKVSRAAGAFLQGYEEPWRENGSDGWVLIEMWCGRTNTAAHQALVDLINRELGLS